MLKDRIQGLLKLQNKTVKDLCAAIEMSDAGLRKIYQRDSCEISTLKKMAEFFDKSPAYFIEDTPEIDIQIHDNERSFNPGQNDSETILDLTRIINEQRKRIDYLTDELLKKK